jgi:hypothetical protein
MGTFLSKLLGSGTGVSSKRFIGFVASVAMILIAIVDLFSDYTVSDYVFDGLMWLAIAGLGFIASERFADVLSARYSSKRNDAPPTPLNDPFSEGPRYPI